MIGAVVVLLLNLGMASPGAAQLQGLERGEWRYLGGDAGHTRSAPQLTQINASNFEDLEVAWTFRGDNFGPYVEYTARSTPVYADGMVYTVLSGRRQVVAMDPATGELLWTFREPQTMRFRRSPRADFGKGVAYAEVDGRGVIFITSAAYFLWALDAKTGQPLDNWGQPTGVEVFTDTGVVDLIPTLVGDWGPWEDFVAAGGAYDPDHGIPQELGMVTSSSPPIVVNGVVVVLIGHEPSYDQTRIENVPGDIQGFDARTGEFLWKFHVIPRPGEVGHETWGERCLAVVGGHVQLGACRCGSRARARVPGDERLDGSVVRGTPARSQSLRRQPHCAGRGDRGAPVAFPDPPE